MKKSTKIYNWLFDEEERAPIGFIPTLFMCIVVSTMVSLLLVPIIYKLMSL